MLAYNLYLLTSLYDKVAYSEGYLTESQNPHVDSGEDMQKHIIGILEEVRGLHAKAKADESNNLSTSADMVFGGNIDGWLQFANTLYLKNGSCRNGRDDVFRDLQRPVFELLREVFVLLSHTGSSVSGIQKRFCFYIGFILPQNR